MRLALLALAGAVVLGGASEVEAAQRYAAPAGSAAACTQAAPCSIAEAISKAASNDEVIVTSGTYSVSETVSPPPAASNVDIHGEFSGPPPRILGTGKGAIPIGMSAGGGRLSYLEIVNEASPAFAATCNSGGLMERMRLTAIGDGSVGLIHIGDCSVRDSVIRVAGEAAIAVTAYGFSSSANRGVGRNLTVIATGPDSLGVHAAYTEFMVPGTYTFDLRNSIVSGELADLRAAAGLGGPGNIVVANSNYDLAKAEAPGTITGTANQTAPPQFVDAASGDYREAAGSPTIDAGSGDGLGALDLEGNPRSLGAAPDIGAFEFVPPPEPLALLEALTVSPAAFRARRSGPAIVSRTRKKAPRGTRVNYRLSARGAVGFAVERRIKGRKVGRRCLRQTRANRKRKRCLIFKKVRGGFSDEGSAGSNGLSFSGRVGGRALRPGRYRLVGTSGESARRVAFRIVR